MAVANPTSLGAGRGRLLPASSAVYKDVDQLEMSVVESGRGELDDPATLGDRDTDTWVSERRWFEREHFRCPSSFALSSSFDSCDRRNTPWTAATAPTVASRDYEGHGPLLAQRPL
jgi:hypothetical protein